MQITKINERLPTYLACMAISSKQAARFLCFMENYWQIPWYNFSTGLRDFNTPRTSHYDAMQIIKRIILTRSTENPLYLTVLSEYGINV